MRCSFSAGLRAAPGVHVALASSTTALCDADVSPGGGGSPGSRGVSEQDAQPDMLALLSQQGEQIALLSSHVAELQKRLAEMEAHPAQVPQNPE